MSMDENNVKTIILTVPHPNSLTSKHHLGERPKPTAHPRIYCPAGQICEGVSCQPCPQMSHCRGGQGSVLLCSGGLWEIQCGGVMCEWVCRQLRKYVIGEINK